MSVVSFRSSASVADTTSTSIAVGKPSGTADGDLLVVAALADSTTNGEATSVPAGWTTENSGAEADLPSHAKLVTYWKIASSEGASWTWGWPASSGHKLIIAGCWTGHGGVTTDSHQNKNSSSASTITTDSFTNAIDNVLIIYAGGFMDFALPLGGMQPVTYDAAVTARASKDNTAGDNDKIVWLADEVITSGNVPGRTFSPAAACAINVLQFRPVLAATATPGFGAWAWRG